MDLEDINPIAVVFGLVGAFITMMMARYSGAEITLFWKILTPIATFFASFAIVQRMSD